MNYSINTACGTNHKLNSEFYKVFPKDLNLPRATLLTVNLNVLMVT